MSLYILVWSWMVALQPQAPWFDTYEETAHAIADTCDAQADSIKCAAHLTAIAWFESSFRQDATGDSGRAYGLFQLHGMPHDADLNTQTAHAVSWILESYRSCHDLTLYASGRCGVGVRESRQRMGLARRLLGK